MNRSVGEEFIEAKEKFGNRNFRVYNSTSSNIGKIIQKEQNKKNKKSKDNIFIKKRKRPPILDSLKGLKKVVALKNKLLKALDKNMLLMIGGIMLAAGALLAASKGGFEDKGSYEDGSGLSSGRLSQKGRERLIADEGGHRLTAYQDNKGIWTIGVGHTGKVDGVAIHKGMTISREKSEQLFENDVKRFEKMVNDAVKVPISQNMFDALVNFTYVNGHIKGTKLLERLNKGDYRGAQQELSIEPIHETRMKRLRQSFGQDITSDNKLKEPTINEAAPILKEGYNGKYYNPNIKTKEGMGTFNNKPITSTFGNRIHPIFRTKKFHAGIDIAYTTNEPVYAFFPGRVIFHGKEGGYGNLVKIKDANDYIHYYGHLNKFRNSYPLHVKEGELIGYAGSTGYATGPHLHYEIRRPDGTPIDPRTYFLDVLSRQQSNEKQSKSRPPLNKNTEIMKNNKNQTNTKQVTTKQNATKQTPNNIRTQKTSNINTANNNIVTGSKLPSHKATQQNTGKKKGL